MSPGWMVEETTLISEVPAVLTQEFASRLFGMLLCAIFAHCLKESKVKTLVIVPYC